MVIRRRTEGSGLGSRARLAILFATVLVDLIGFGIVLPLLPFYADRFGGTGVAIGFLVTVYSAAQLFSAPLWGRLSDRYGRRPILIVGLVSSGISYLVFAYATTLAVLFLSRVLAGIGGATVTVAQAYIADVTPPEKRAANMGLLGAAFGVGFVLGPVMGGILAPISLAAPGLAAAGLCLTNAVIAVWYLPESLPPEDRGSRSSAEPGERIRSFIAAATSPQLLRILSLSFFFTIAFASMHPTFPLFGQIRFGFDERQVGYLFAFIGTISAIMQGGVVRRLAPVMGEVALIRTAAIPFVAGLLMLALAPTVPLLLLGLALMSIGFGGTLPSILSLLSRSAPANMQGSIMGVGQSVDALGRIIGPVLAGFAFDGWGIAWPYIVGSAIGGVAFLVSLTVAMPGRR